jgi:hypothetical protein
MNYACRSCGAAIEQGWYELNELIEKIAGSREMADGDIWNEFLKRYCPDCRPTAKKIMEIAEVISERDHDKKERH